MHRGYDKTTAQRYEIIIKIGNKNKLKSKGMEKVKIFKPDGQRWREKRDMAIYKEYTELMSAKGQSKTGVNDYLMKKYGIHSQGTIYVIRRRVEKQLKAKEAKA